MNVLDNIKLFFKDISNFFHSGSVLGVDIGTSSIKISEVSQKEGDLSLKNYGILETRDYLKQSNLSIQNSSLEIEEEETARLLNTLLREMKPESNTALVSIPSFSSFVTLIDMPQLSDEETRQSINYQAKQYIPMDLSSVSVDWLKVDEYQNKEGKKFQRLLLIGIPKKTINSYKNICKKAGLRVVMMELDSIALANSFSRFHSPTLVIDIGASSTSVSVIENYYVKFTSQTDHGGLNLTRSVSQGLDLDMTRSESLKKKRGLAGRGGDTELSTLITPFLDVIIEEVKQVRRNYETRYNKEVKQIVMAGGGSNLNGIEGYFAKRLELQTVPSDSLVDINYPTYIEPAVVSLKKELPVSIGLAKKYFTE